MPSLLIGINNTRYMETAIKQKRRVGRPSKEDKLRAPQIPIPPKQIIRFKQKEPLVRPEAKYSNGRSPFGIADELRQRKFV